MDRLRQARMRRLSSQVGCPFPCQREPLWGQLQTPGATATEAHHPAAFYVEHHFKARFLHESIASSVQRSGCQRATPGSYFRQLCITERREGSILSERVQAHQCIQSLPVATDGSRCRSEKASPVMQPGQRAYLSHLVSSCKALVLR